MLELNRIYCGDNCDLLGQLPRECIDLVVTSPPYYGLRDYGHPGQIGLEKTPAEYVAALVEVFEGVRELLADDGVLWLNLGDSYGHGTSASRKASTTSTKISAAQHEAQGGRHGGPAKQLLGIPWRVALAMQDAGWLLRQEVIWEKPNSMPESVTDRCVKSHEHLFLLAKSVRYRFDHTAIQETGANGEKRNKRSVWSVPTKPFKGAHFAVFPPDLIQPCIKAGSQPGEVVFDPFMGSGTTGEAAHLEGRRFIGMERETEYFQGIAVPRVRAAAQQQPLLPPTPAPVAVQEGFDL